MPREQHCTQSPFPRTPTKARSPRKPLKFHLKPTNATANTATSQAQAQAQAQARLKPLNCYKRRKSLHLQPRPVKQLPPEPLSTSSPSDAPVQQGFMDAANNRSRGSMLNTDNQNPSSILKDITVVPENVGTKEGTPSSKALVLASPNCNADLDPSPNSGSNWFQKTPAIWEAVEKLKVFSQSPQQPHFMKLQSYPPEMREGIALGLMVTYANLVDSFKNLSCDDEITVILEKAACLDPLEENGFDVGRFWTRLTELLQLKTEYMESKERILRLELQLADKETEMTPLKMVQLQMGDVSREINLVKEMINKLIVKRDQLLDQTVVNGHEISRIKEAMSDNSLDELARQEFASLLAKPL